MQITTNRLILDEISWDDFADIHELYSYTEVDQYFARILRATIVE